MSNAFKSRKKNNKKFDEDDKLRIITKETNFSIKESYKAIRANINFAVPNEGCKKIMICSSFSGEGKTTTCVNLAISIAQTGSEVLLIDCDMRRSRIHEFFALENERGLSNYLSSALDMDDIVQETSIEELNIISAGTVPPNPAELLANPKIDALLARVSKLYDYIILDTPPVCVVSDALPLSKKCDGVILIVKHRETMHKSIRDSLDKLSFAGAKVIGMVLNGIKLTREYKSYGKYGKYNKYNYESKSEPVVAEALDKSVDYVEYKIVGNVLKERSVKISEDNPEDNSKND